MHLEECHLGKGNATASVRLKFHEITMIKLSTKSLNCFALTNLILDANFASFCCNTISTFALNLIVKKLCYRYQLKANQRLISKFCTALNFEKRASENTTLLR